MPAFTALALGLSAAAGVAGVVNANNQRKDAKKTAKKQETAAKNAAALELTADTTDPNFVLGTEDEVAARRTSGTADVRSKRAKPTSGMATGGITASSVGGL